MANNIVETIQKNLGYPALQKIDPNSQEIKEKTLRPANEKLAQAAIPAVLTALHKFTRTDEDCNVIISKGEHDGWLKTLFEDKEMEAVDKVARYAGVANNEAETAMKKIADESVATLKDSAGTPVTISGIRNFMDFQRHNILSYLPAALQMGDVLNDEALDDRTNKMEGPVSNFLHKVENILSKGDESKYP